MRRYLKRFILLFLLLSWISLPTFDDSLIFSPFISLAGAKGEGFIYTPEVADTGYKEKDFRDYVGEKLFYKLSFLFFRHVADAEFHFGKTDTPGRFYASLDVQARGFVGWITRQRRHTYTSEFELVDGGRHLRSIHHKRVISYGERKEVYESRADYLLSKYSWKIFKNGQIVQEGGGAIPEGKILEDILSAFYNFRRGAFGQVTYGRDYRIDTIPGKKGVTHFDVKVAKEKENEYSANNRENNFDKTYLLTVDIPPEIFDSKTGNGEIWLTAGMIPLEGLIKDVKDLGDVVGKLQEVSFSNVP